MKEREHNKGVILSPHIYRAFYKGMFQGVNMSQYMLKHIVNSIKITRRLRTHVS